MNLAAQHPTTLHIYLVSAMCLSDGTATIRSRSFDYDGRLLETYASVDCAAGDAWRVCSEWIRQKITKREYREISIESLPSQMRAWLAPKDVQLSQSDAVRILQDVPKEREVIFRDVVGMEDYYDEGIPYLSMDDLGNPEYISVYDRFGELRAVKRSRLQSISKSERCAELENIRQVM